MYEWSVVKCATVILSVAVAVTGTIAAFGIVLNMQPSKDYRLMKVCLSAGQAAKDCSDAVYGPPGLPK